MTPGVVNSIRLTRRTVHPLILIELEPDMAQEPTPIKASDAIPDYDALMAQLTSLRGEMAKLASSVGKSGSAIAQDMTDGLNDARRYVSRKGHDVDLRVEGAVAANPYMALGLAAGLGLLLGVLSRR